LEDFYLKVEKSAVAKNAGEGVFNRGEVIKEGTVFGPYVGKEQVSCCWTPPSPSATRLPSLSRSGAS